MKTDNRFRISIPRLVELLLPMGMRAKSLKTIICAGIKSIEVQHNNFLRAMEDDRFRIHHNGQVCYLQAALNKHFKPPKDKPFLIKEPYGGLEWLYAQTEKPEITAHINAKSEDTTEGHIFAPDYVEMDNRNSFVVYIPNEVGNDENIGQIKQFVNEYRLVTRIPQYVIY